MDNKKSEYSRKYYNENKHKFKIYYQTYKSKQLAKKNGTYSEPETQQLTKRQRNVLKHEKRLKKNNAKRDAYIELLKKEGWYNKES